MRACAVFEIVLIGIFFVTISYGQEMGKYKDYKLGWRSAAAAGVAHSIAKTAEEYLKQSSTTTVYATAGENAALLIIYGIELKTEQVKLIELIAEEQKRMNWPTIYIEFRRHEIWIEKDNGVKERGAEEILATTTLPNEAQP